MYIRLHVKCPLLQSDFNVNFLDIFSKTPQISTVHGSRVICPMRTDRQANMTKLRVAFRNFANALNSKYK